MGIHKGTKLTQNPKNNTFKIRLDDEISEKLTYLSNKKSISKSEIIRKGIEIQYDEETQ